MCTYLIFSLISYFREKILILNMNVVRGFIVNVHDPLNYDIDLDLNDAQKQAYSKVLSNSYIKKDYVLNGTKLEVENMEKEDTSVAYRCRLKGVSFNNTLFSQKKYKFKIFDDEEDPFKIEKLQKEAYVEISRIFDASDGWVDCELHEPDIFSRILVSLKFFGTSRDISDIFFQEKYRQVFYRYPNEIKI